MTIIDVNVLIYAYNADCPQHKAAIVWLTKLFESDETIGFPWISIWGFLRISTNPRVWVRPLTSKSAFAIVREWLTRPGVVLLHPGPRHTGILERLVTDHDSAGPKLTDAVLAALAIENGASLASADHGFHRFRGLRWIDPLRSPAEIS